MGTVKLFYQFIFFSLILLTCSFLQANDQLACEDLAKATCGNVAVANESNFQALARSISSEFKLQLSKQQKDATIMIQFFEKIKQQLPQACQFSMFEKTACENQTSILISNEAEEFHKWMLKKPSKYDDPNFERPAIFLNTYNTVAFEQTKKSFTAEFAQEIKRSQAMFKDVQKALIEKISLEVTSGPERQAMIERLSTIKYDPELCMQTRDARYYLNRTAYYQNRTHKFTMCPKLFFNPVTDAQLAFIIGHELAHSIDPCIGSMAVGYGTGQKLPLFVNYQKNSHRVETYGFKLSMHPYSEQFKCLRNDSSSGSKIPSPQAFDKNVKNQQFYDTLCDLDPITESFCDWMGTESVAAVIYGRQMKKSAAQNRQDFATTLSSKCMEARAPTDVHALLDRRINGVISAHPKIRQAMGCTNSNSENVYCPPPPHRSNTQQNSTSGSPPDLDGVEQ